MIKALKPSTLTAILHIYSCTSRFNHDVKILWHNISLGYHIEQNRSKFPSNWIELELLSSNLFGLGSVIERNGTQNFSVSSISERNRTKSFDFVRFFRKSNFELKSKMKSVWSGPVNVGNLNLFSWFKRIKWWAIPPRWELFDMKIKETKIQMTFTPTVSTLNYFTYVELESQKF